MGMRCECPFAMTSVRKRTSTSGRIIFLRLASMRAMEFRQLGKSGLKVPVLSFGTGTFGGGTEFFKAWGASDVAEATRLVDVCLEAGVNLFDTADMYSKELYETTLGKAVAGGAKGGCCRWGCTGVWVGWRGVHWDGDGLRERSGAASLGPRRAGFTKRPSKGRRLKMSICSRLWMRSTGLRKRPARVCRKWL